ncbi:hypothetical protein QUB05_05560 [Microcoleus sp. F10-C6]|uniref:hypothetical protein n=1 Tax=unclassified Microcoleus TaxID=2642155 RepID=UPI002FD5AD46
MTSIISLIVLWNVTRGVLTLLANIQRKLTVLRSLYISQRAEVRDIQNYLKTHHGYHVRGGIHDIQEDLLKEYNNENTGF